jgi:hypothetical protein
VKAFRETRNNLAAECVGVLAAIPAMMRVLSSVGSLVSVLVMLLKSVLVVLVKSVRVALVQRVRMVLVQRMRVALVQRVRVVVEPVRVVVGTMEGLGDWRRRLWFAERFPLLRIRHSGDRRAAKQGRGDGDQKQASFRHRKAPFRLWALQADLLFETAKQIMQLLVVKAAHFVLVDVQGLVAHENRHGIVGDKKQGRFDGAREFSRNPEGLFGGMRMKLNGHEIALLQPLDGTDG